MSEPGSPMGLPAPNPASERDARRLLFVVVGILLTGAVAFAVITLTIA